MKATCKPQTKKPDASRRKLGCARAPRIAAPVETSGSGSSAASSARPVSATARQRHQQHEAREQQQRGHRPVAADERLAERRDRNCPIEPAAVARPIDHDLRSSGTSRAKGGQHDRERPAGQSEPEEHPARDRQRRGTRAHGHERRSGRVHHAAHGEDPARAVAVGDPARERLPDPPEEVLQRDREGDVSRSHPRSAESGSVNRPKLVRRP